jgi:hypothetical protein
MEPISCESVPAFNQLSITPWRRMGSGGIAPPLFASALHGWEWSASSSGRSASGETSPNTNRIWGCVSARAALERKISYSCRKSNPDRPARKSVAIPSELSWLLLYSWDSIYFNNAFYVRCVYICSPVRTYISARAHTHIYMLMYTL